MASSAALAISACAGRAFASPMDELVATARTEGQLTVISLARDWCGYGAVIDGFKAKYGLTLNELQPGASSDDEIEAVKASRGNAGPQAPDVIDIGLSFGKAAKREGLLRPYKVSAWDTIPDSAKDPDGHWYGDYYGVLAFEINTDLVSKIPEDWPDLMAPEYRNSVALAGDLSSNQALQGVFAAGLSAASGSIEKAANQGLRFFAELNRRGNFVPFIGDQSSLADGRTPILIRWHYLALGDRDRLKDSTDIKIVVPKTGVVAGIYVQAISAFAPHPNAARLWMEYLYSDEAQLTLLNGHCYPIRFGDLMRKKKVAELPLDGLDGDHDTPVFPSLEEQEKAKEIIVNGWDDIVGEKVQCFPDDPSLVPMSLNDADRQASIQQQV